jgi:hypothetical protein
MSPEPTCDDALARRLPLPLAQLYRRAWNERNPRDRNEAAYYLWEAALKLLASAAIVEYAERPGPDTAAAALLLQDLPRPATGHWVAFARKLLPLAAAGDPGFTAVRDRLLREPLTDLPRAADLHSRLAEEFSDQGRAAGEGSSDLRRTEGRVKLADLFDRMVKYRNRFIGHAGLTEQATHERLERVLLPGVGEVLDRLDVLAGRRLLFVDEVRRTEDGPWSVEWWELSGEVARRLTPLLLPEDAATPLPRRVYLRSGGDAGPPALRPLHPLVLFPDVQREEVFFFNGQVDRQRAEYLCYTNNRQHRDDLGRERRPLLAQALQPPAEASPVPAGPAARPSPTVPTTTPAPDPPKPEPVAPGTDRLWLALLYKRNAQPDEQLVRLLEREFTARGHEVFVDRHITAGEAWANRLERQVRDADVVVALLSAAAAQSEMLTWELQTADDENRRRGRPRLLPVRVAFEGPLPPELGGILDRLQYVLWRDAQDDARVVAELDAALRAPERPPTPT